MLLESALLLCLIIFLVVLFVFYILGNIRFWSCVALAFLFGLIVLLLCFPPLLLIAEKPSWQVVLYGVFILIAIVVLILYILSRALVDKRCHNTCKEDIKEEIKTDCV